MNLLLLMTSLVIAICALPSLCFAADSSQIFGSTTLLFVIILLAAKWMGFLFKKVGMPELVGELMAGVILGNLNIMEFSERFHLELSQNQFLQYAAELGIVLLLFEVGLESKLTNLLKVGLSAFLVACLGVVLPVVLGLGVASVLSLGGGLAGWFIGATLAATSIGVTAKVLGDAKLIQKESSQIILGAAIIDDVLGLLLLALLAGVASSSGFAVSELVWLLIKAAIFFAFCVLFSKFALSKVVKVFDFNTATGTATVFALVFALGLASLSALAGLAPIIGAFTAGLILEDTHFFRSKRMDLKSLHKLLLPLMDILLPVFFVTIGAQVKLAGLLEIDTLIAVLTLTAVAIIGKTLSGWAATGKQYDRLGIGFGMVPRGEVGLIFASYGLSHHIFSSKLYSVLVLTVLLTTILGPILLKPRLRYF